MDVLHIVLIALVAVAIWAVIELALTIRKARASVDEITRTANDTIQQVQPIIAKADGMVDDLQPSIKGVQPLIDKAGTAVDVATVDLATLNDILSDVSDVSGAASNVTNTVSRVADSAANGVAGALGKITGKTPRQPSHLTAGSAEPKAVEAPEAKEQAAPEHKEAPKPQHAARPAASDSYVTYDSTNSDAVDGD